MTAKKQKSLTFNTQFNLNYKGAKGETNTLPSQTVPDMTLSVLELLQNHTRGIHSEVNQIPGEYFDTEIPQIDDPLTQLPELRKELEEKQKALEKRLKDEQAQKGTEVPESSKTTTNETKTALDSPITKGTVSEKRTDTKETIKTDKNQ